MPAIGSSSSSSDGLGRERARELHALLQAVGQAADRRLADVLDLQEVDDLLDLRPVLELLALGAPEVDRLLEERRLHPQVAAGHDVVQHRHALEQRDVLERARDALARGLVRAPSACACVPRNVIAPELRMVDAVDHVEHRALARAVRPDDRADLVLAHVEAHVGERLHAAEGERDVLEREDHVADAALGSARRLMRPPRRAPRSAASCAARPGRSSPRGSRRSAATMPVRPSSNLTCVSMCCTALPRVQRLDQHRVLLGDEAAAHLARARQLVVVGVELLVQHQEAVDLRVGDRRVGGELGIDLLDALRGSARRPPAWPRGRCSPSRRARAARPSCRPSRCRC